ncbi:MAG: hypothetical protein V3T01_06405 [Myxococcota bacterium]
MRRGSYRMPSSTSSILLRIAALLGAASLVGCIAYGRGQRDVDRSPIVDTGVGATVLYPGESPVPPRGPTIQRSHSGPGSEAATRSGTPAGAAGSPGESVAITSIGRAQRDEVSHAQYREDPLFHRYLALPFVWLAAPFRLLSMTREPEPGPEVPRATVARPLPVRSEPLPDYEASRLRELEQELDERIARARPRHEGQPPHPRRSPSIAEELAALQRGTAPSEVASSEPGRATPLAPSPPSAPPTTAHSNPRVLGDRPAHGVVDRDRDGRIDHWIYRENGEISREVFDEDSDGQPDRVLVYDLVNHRIGRVEEDTDHDGSFDSWTDYREGVIVRRRADTNRDGAADTWSYYAAGNVTRHERDTTGDGFRDRVGLYDDEGRLGREELDTDGDGRLDTTLHYDAEERMIRKEEDTDGDGLVDLLSHYESGRLTRRELLDPALLGAESHSPRTEEN